MRKRTIICAILGAIGGVIAALLLSGCVSYAKVDRVSAEECHAVVRGNFFSFTTPAVLEECRTEIDR